MIARLGHELLRRRPPNGSEGDDPLRSPAPLFAAVEAMVVAEVAHPRMTDTHSGRMARRLGLADLLQTLDGRIRDRVGTELVLASELLHRELCAGLGPLGALVLLTTHSSGGAQADDDALEGALCAELVSTFAPMLAASP